MIIQLNNSDKFIFFKILSYQIIIISA